MRRAARGLAVASLAALGLLVALWLLEITGRPAGAGVHRAAAAVAGLVWLLWGLVELVRRGFRAEPGAASEARWLVALVALSLMAYGWGVSHEVGGRYYWDEGTYASRVVEINQQGRLFSDNLVYPHLLFYVEAFANWLSAIAAAPLAAIARAVAGIEDWPTIMRWLYRLVVATFGALTVVPVYLAARVVAGRAAATLAGLAMICSSLYLAGAKLNTCDVPSAFFAALSFYWVARLTRGETLRDYLLAGAAAGLAAGTKYPAGSVAVAIVAIWIAWRLRERDLKLGLVWAGLASVAALLAATPALLVHAETVFGSGWGVLFGFGQYARGGWVGVVPDSNLAYYARLIGGNFGWPLVVLGIAGLALTAPAVRRRALLLTPFPVVFLILLSSMSMVVARNIYPALPALAVLLGTGLAVLYGRLRAWRPPAGAWAAVALCALALARPAFDSAALVYAHGRRSTRELAQQWAAGRLPPGAAVYKERYTPNLDRRAYHVVEQRFGPNLALADVRNGWDYLVLASHSWGRWFEPNYAGVEHYDAFQRWYRTVFDELELLADFRPSRTRLGPEVRFYRLDPEAAEHRSGRRFEAAEIFLPGRWKLQPEGHVWFARPGRWCVLKGHFAPGRYRLTVEGGVEPPARLIVADPGNQTVARLELAGTTSPPFTLPRAERYFFRLELGERSWIRGVDIRREPGADPASEVPGSP